MCICVCICMWVCVCACCVCAMMYAVRYCTTTATTNILLLHIMYYYSFFVYMCVCVHDVCMHIRASTYRVRRTNTKKLTIWGIKPLTIKFSNHRLLPYKSNTLLLSNIATLLISITYIPLIRTYSIMQSFLLHPITPSVHVNTF